MLSFFSKKKKYRRKFTLTYFIPCPPNRKTGYREREFDEIITNLLHNDFELIEMKTETAINQQGSGGMWAICLFGALTEKAASEHKNIVDLYGLKIDHTNPHIEIEIDYDA